LPISKITFLDCVVEAIYNPKLKHSYIQIDAHNTIRIKTPFRSKNFVLSLLEDKKDWILKQINKNRQKTRLSIVLGEEILLFGNSYNIGNSEIAASLYAKLQRAHLYSPEKTIKLYDNFYKELAKEYLAEELELYASRMQLSFSEFKVRKMRRRWGSCSSRGVLTFNTELMKLNKEMITYVVVHELAHLQYMNHSKAFHELVRKTLPDADSIRKNLQNIQII